MRPLDLRAHFARLVALARTPSAVYLAASVLGRLGTILLLPLYTRRLSEADYGTYALAQTLVSLSPTLLSFGGVAAINRFFFDEPSAADGLRATGSIGRWVLAVSSLNGLLVCGPMMLLARTFHLLTPLQVAYVVLAGVGQTMLTFPSVILRCEQRVYAAAAFQGGELLVSALCGIVLVGGFHRGLEGSIEALALTYALGGLVTIAFFALHARGPWDVPLGKKAFRFSITFVPHFLALWLQNVSDRWTLKFTGEDAAVGAYSAASQLSSPASMVVNAWNLDRSTRNGELVREGGLPRLRRALPGLLRSYALAAIIPGIGTMCALPLLRFVVGRAFLDGLVYLPVLLAVVAIDALYHPFNHIVYYGDKSRWIAVATAAAAVIAIVANVVLVPLFGVAGALGARCLASGARVGTMAIVARMSVTRVAAEPEGAHVA